LQSLLWQVDTVGGHLVYENITLTVSRGFFNEFSESAGLPGTPAEWSLAE